MDDLYSKMFDLKSDKVVFDVQIIKCDNNKSWYLDRIGETFSVIDHGEGDDLTVVMKYKNGKYLEEGTYIKKIDAIIIN
jgi:hypothetical protein